MTDISSLPVYLYNTLTRTKELFLAATISITGSYMLTSWMLSHGESIQLIWCVALIWAMFIGIEKLSSP